MEEKKEIDHIIFGVLSPEETIDMSVCEVNSNKLYGKNSVYDERMGITENNKICPQCNLDNKLCPGHFGYIRLNYEIMHPLFYKTILAFLKCFCYKCSGFLFLESQLELNGTLLLNCEVRFNKILELVDKVDMCPHCSGFQPKKSFSPTENTINLIYKKNKINYKTQLSENEIKKIFENIPDKDITLLGLNPTRVHPKNLIISILPVLPPVDRPFIVADDITCDDDLTLQYLEIIKANNHLENKNLSESKRQKYIQSLKFRIKCLFDNSQEKAKHTNGRPMKGLKKRLTGKEGQIRNNLMGKRVDKSGRSVIGPDPTLKIGEIAIPKKIAEILTYPVRINKHNYEMMTILVNNGKANFVLRNEGKTRINLKYAMKKKNFNLEHGDVVERHLQDGDVVLLNRQPTLHKGSMLAQRIIIRDGKTIRMNLAITKTFNADFDGDEMNIHVPATLEGESELINLSGTKYNMMAAQSSKSTIAIVQDSLLGAFLMTKDNEKMSKAWFFQIINQCDWDSSKIMSKIKHLEIVLKKLKKPELLYTGKGLVSLLLPEDLIYEKKNKAVKSEPILKIYQGVIFEGAINKSIIGSSHNSLIQIFHKEYGEDAAEDFVNNIQFLANAWLIYHGFSVGIEDCIPTKSSEIENVVTKCFAEAMGVEETTKNPLIREAKVNAALSKARDNGMRIAKEALSEDNNFIATVTSGSKGDYFNITQITGLLGQQNLMGGRIQPTMNKNKRSLSHYPFELSKEEEYESYGFISNSFSHGLNPREFFFHAMTGREGVTDTAMKTAQSGYIQRRMVKVAEDVQVKYDGTVRNSAGSIIQFQYGEDGLDGCNTVIVDNKPQICDVSRLADQLNLQCELGDI